VQRGLTEQLEAALEQEDEAGSGQGSPDPNDETATRQVSRSQGNEAVAGPATRSEEP
jgi:hypothetical protein